MKKKNWFLRHKIVSGIIIFIILMVIIGNKNGDSQKGFQDGMNAVKTSKTNERSLKEKQEIFLKVAEAENKAMKEAEGKYPTNIYNIDVEQAKKNVEPNAELSQELEEKYRQEILNEYNVSKDEWLKIGTEGVKDNWPVSGLN